VARIRSGEKRYEFRKRGFSRPVGRIIIYETSPVSKVVGSFIIEGIIEDAPKRLWIKTKGQAGGGRDDLMAYFGYVARGVAIKIGAVTFFDRPIPLTDLIPNAAPPQSFRYVEPGLLPSER